MKKEVLIAIIIGFGLGLVITFGIWTANRSLKDKETNVETAPEVEEISPTPTTQPELSLTIDTPEDEFLTDQDTIEVSGSTASGAIVVILFPEGEKILEADQDGNFKTEIELAGGENEIKISAFDDAGEEVEKTVTVVYSTAKI